MTIRAKVALAIEPEVRAHWLSINTTRAMIDHTINAFLAVAAESGWHMRPDEATEEMVHTANDFGYTSAYTMRQDSQLIDQYRAMLAAAPEFKWGK